MVRERVLHRLPGTRDRTRNNIVCTLVSTACTLVSTACTSGRFKGIEPHHVIILHELEGIIRKLELGTTKVNGGESTKGQRMGIVYE